ncbi:MAG: cysteine dioxygenase [Gammaproteobacteria bacterium]|nr:MAG: cysteine dioxygenase [Gammaproteobacteria bacterium]
MGARMSAVVDLRQHRDVSGRRPSGPLAVVPPALARYVAHVESLLAGAADEEALAARVAGALGELACERDLLAPEQRIGDAETYTRHLLYADPEGRFSVLALVWMPGQGTPVHGHTAWGAVAVHEGRPTVALYEYEPGYGALPRQELQCVPGEVSWVRAGIQYPHRICNTSDRPAITLHTYGRDLSRNPTGINILV